MRRNNWMSLTSTRMESADYRKSSNSIIGFPRRWSPCHYNHLQRLSWSLFASNWREGVFDEAKSMMYSLRQASNLRRSRRSGERAKLTFSTWTTQTNYIYITKFIKYHHDMEDNRLIPLDNATSTDNIIEYTFQDGLGTKHI